MRVRTDLALEAKELWEQSAGKTTRLPGVAARSKTAGGVEVTTVEVLDGRGEKALGKPAGTYVTLELRDFARKHRDSLPRAAEVLARQLRPLLGLNRGDPVLVAGLGNEAVTPDAVGPKVVRRLLVTRHLVEEVPSFFGGYRPVSAVTPGVLGTTGLESAQVVAAVAQRVKPRCVVVVDALAARELRRVCTTVQLTDTGITPGSGVQNAREALSRAQLGIPVVAVGVPTVADVETLLRDSGAQLSRRRAEALCGGQRMMVTPQDIDAQVERIAKLVAWGLNLALQENLELEDVAFLTE